LHFYNQVFAAVNESEFSLLESGRLNEYLRLTNIINDRLWLGCGIGNWQNYGTFAYPHNLIVEALGEMGLLGLVLIGYFFYLFIKLDDLMIRSLSLFCLINAMLSGSIIDNAFALILIELGTLDEKRKISK
jgi:O-antigen ligase